MGPMGSLGRVLESDGNFLLSGPPGILWAWPFAWFFLQWKPSWCRVACWSCISGILEQWLACLHWSTSPEWLTSPSDSSNDNNVCLFWPMLWPCFHFLSLPREQIVRLFDAIPFPVLLARTLTQFWAVFNSIFGTFVLGFWHFLTMLLPVCHSVSGSFSLRFHQLLT